MNDRVIFHIDMNNFFASVEGIDRPELLGVPYAVCGEPELRHGIVLAKNQIAKQFGIKTGDTIFMAKQKCPELIVLSPNYSKYEEISRQARAIYETYTDRVESFGIDECWCDMSGAVKFSSARELADVIRAKIRDTLHITVSIGVSFNKIFAKLGSDMKKPDATTVISRDGLRDTVWKLPASALMFVGGATQKMLSRYSIYTIGDIAESDPKLLELLLGKNGRALYNYANGMDASSVALADSAVLPKSVSRSCTPERDLCSKAELRALGSYLSDCISFRLHELDMLCSSVGIVIKDTEMRTGSKQKRLSEPCSLSRSINSAAMSLVDELYRDGSPVRAFGVCAFDLKEADNVQLSFDINGDQRYGALEDTVFDLRSRFGTSVVKSASQLSLPRIASRY